MQRLQDELISWVPIIVTVSILYHCGSAEGQLIVAHRGASDAAPENTLAAFELAWKMGADAIEGDFYLTRDGHIVAMHDRTTKRTSGVDLAMADSTLDELRKLDVGSWKSNRYRGERIPTIQEVFNTVPAGTKIFIEIKCGPEIVPKLKEVLAEANLQSDQTVVISFDAEVIVATKRQIPHVRAHWLTGYKQDEETGKWSPTTDEVMATLNRIGADGLDTNANETIVEKEFIKRLRSAGFQFHVWTIDDPAVARRFQRLGVDSITTNRPILIRDGLMSQDLHEHLQLHLAMDGDLQDTSGHNRHGELVTSSGDEGRFSKGVFGEALDLKEGNSAVAVKYRLPESGSILLWYYARPWYDHQTIFDNSLHENLWEMWIYADGRLRFRNAPKASTLRYPFHPTGDVNEWHHIAVTWGRRDRSDVIDCLYVNGRLVQSTRRSRESSVKPGDQFYLAGGQTDNSKGNGRWDDVAIFDAVLKPSDIRSIMVDGISVLRTITLQRD